MTWKDIIENEQQKDYYQKLKEEIKNSYEDKEDQKELFDGLKTVKKTLEEFDKQQNQGNLPRAKYFLEIKEEIKKLG